MQLKKILAIFAFFISLSFLSTSKIFAANLTLTCDGVGPCSLSPYSGVALFQEPDIKPSYNVPREIRIINTSLTQDCNLVLDTKNEMISLQNRFGNFVDVTPVLNTVIKDSSSHYFGQILGSWSASSYQNLHDLFNTGTISLGTIPRLSSKTFLWAVTMDPNAGNEYQGITVTFDFDLTFSCEGGTGGGGKTSSMGKSGPTCENTDIYVTYDVKDDGNPVEDVEVTFTYLGGNERKVKTNADGRASTAYGYSGAGDIRAEAPDYPSQSIYIKELICPNPTPTPIPTPTLPPGGFVQGVQDFLFPSPTPEVFIPQEGEVSGEKTCCPKIEPWWWILLFSQNLFLLNFYLKKIRQNKKADWISIWLITTIVGIIAHFILHRIFVNNLNYQESRYCDYFWLISLITNLIISITYKNSLKNEK